MNSITLTTVSGYELDLLNPDPNKIFMDDIIYGLSFKAHYMSQIKRFFSIAEHYKKTK